MSQPSTQDFNKGFDPTGYPDISGAALGQLVDQATLVNDKGLTITTADVAGVPQVPDANTNTKWQKYLWRRVTATAVNAYLWNDNGASDATYQQWVSVNIAGIGAGSIVNSMLQDNTITDIKIANVNWSKITGAPTFLSTGSACTGDLLGSLFSNMAIAAGAVTTVKIAPNAITHALLGAQAVQPVTDLLNNGSYQDMLRTNAGATAVEWFTPPSIFKSGVVVTTANQYKIPQVATAGASDGGTWQMVAPTTLGRILQIVEKEDSTAYSNTGVLANSTSAPNYNATGMNALTGLNTTITPISASSVLLIEVTLNLYPNGAGHHAVTIHAATGATAPLAAVAVYVFNAAYANLQQVKLTYKYAYSSVTPLTIYPAFGTTVTHSYVNSTDGSTALFGGIISSVKITEYI